MTKEEIYDHLAKVYLGKKKKKKQSIVFDKVHVLLFVNILVIIIFLGCFLFYSIDQARHGEVKEITSSIKLALNHYPLRLKYDFIELGPQVENFSMVIGGKDFREYNFLGLSVKGTSRAYPRLFKITIENTKREKADYYIDDVDTTWKEVIIPLGEFKKITDWSSIEKISFVFEAWNLDNTKGMVLLDDICFYKIRR